MTWVEPSIPADPPPPTPLPPTYHPFHKGLFLKSFPFPHKFDCARIEMWVRTAKKVNATFKDFSAIVKEASHTDPDHL